MFGLIVLIAFSLYFLVSFFVVRAAVLAAKARGKSHWLWGGLAAFAMYNLVFWDWIPTIASHQYHCAKESGFWVYKSVDQWKAENPGVLETLVENDVWQEKMYWSKKYKKNIKISEMNNRFGTFYSTPFNNSDGNELFLHVWRRKLELIDLKRNEVIAKSIDFSTGTGHIGGSQLHLRFQSSSCFNADERSVQFDETIKILKGIKQ